MAWLSYSCKAGPSGARNLVAIVDKLPAPQGDLLCYVIERRRGQPCMGQAELDNVTLVTREELVPLPDATPNAVHMGQNLSVQLMHQQQIHPPGQQQIVDGR